jgi:chromate reductase
MYTIISATHRPDSNTLRIAKIYLQILQDQGLEAQILSLVDLPHDFIFTDSFGLRTERFQQIIDRYLLSAQKIIVVAPEYNGGIPGIFNAFLDAVNPESLAGKKVALVGVATGRGGNSRGLDHLVNCLHYLGVEVYHKLVPISQVLTLLDPQGELKSDYIRHSLSNQAEGFARY